MNFRKSFDLLTVIVTGWALANVCWFSELHPLGIALAVLGFVGAVAGRTAPALQFPGRVWLLISIAVLGASLYAWFVAGQRFYAVVGLFIYLALNKLWTARKYRDHLQLFGLSFFLMLAAAVSTEHVGFAPALLIYLFLILAALITLTVKRDAELALSPEERPASGLLPRRVAEQDKLRMEAVLLRAWLTPRFARWLGGVMIIVIIVGGALFFVIPRIQAQSFITGLGPQPGAQVKSGFNDSVEFVGFGEIQTDPTISMRVKPVRGYPMENGVPQFDVLRVRGTALDTYDGRRWVKTEWVRGRLTSERSRLFEFGEDPSVRYSRRILVSTIHLEPNSKGFLFGPDRPSRFAFQTEASVVRDSLSGSLQMMSAWPDTLNYTVESRLPDEDWWKGQPPETVRERMEDFVATWRRTLDGLRGASRLTFQRSNRESTDDVVRRAYLQLPDHPDIATVRRLADEWTRDASDAPAKARAIENFLRFRFSYSLDVSFSPRADHLTAFLTDIRAGHCEYFATSMVLMLRAEGIPARIVNGYATDEWVPGGGYYLVRQEHAHSWVEAWFPESGWITFDPTPSSGIGGNRLGFTWLRQVSQWIDTLKFYWYDTIIDYGVQDQTAMWALLFRGIHGLPSPRDLLSSGLFQLRSMLDGGGLSGGKQALLLLIVAAAGVLGFLLWRELAKLRRARRQDALTARYGLVEIRPYLDLQRELETRLPRSPAETPREFARRVESAGTLPGFAPLTEDYYAARFNGTAWSPELTERANTLLRQLRQPAKN